MRNGASVLLAVLAGFGLVFFSISASATQVEMVSGNVTYQIDDAQTGFTNFGPAANNGIDFNPDFSAFLPAGGSTVMALLNFQVFGNDAGGGNVFAFDDFDFTLEGIILSIPGTVDISMAGTVDVIGASQGGVDIGNPGLLGVSVIDSLSGTTGAWSNTQSWNIFGDFLDGTAYETAVATGLDFSLTATFTANGASIAQVTEAMSNIGASVQPGVPIPEPTTGLLLGLGLLGIGWTRRHLAPRSK